MGAQQSSGGAAGGGAGPPAETKTSYYALLGLERAATDDEIKKAYRRKALEHHPDRNYGNVERATLLFADVQAAYDVLSDPHERAWYDAHEGDMLRGGAGDGPAEDRFENNVRVTTADDLARLMGKFRSNVEFTDAPTGFFGFLRDTFATLAHEEERAADWDGHALPAYPTFGHRDDGYDDVVKAFYTGWSAFATRKSFAWKDQHRLSDAPDRRIRRLMEKENRRFRDEGIREFNDAVRTLVAFVRRRDPRYTPNKQSEEERAKAQRDKARAQAAKARAAQAAHVEDVVPDWAKARDADEEQPSSEEEIEEEHYECVACKKTFKSEKQYDAHERSKKHQKAIYALRKQMQQDNAHLNLDEHVVAGGSITPIEGDSSAEDASGGDQAADGVADEVEHLTMEDQDDNDNSDSHSHSDSHSDESTPATSNTVPAAPMDVQAGQVEEETDSDTNSDYASRDNVESRISGFPSTAASTATIIDGHGPQSRTTAPKLGKAAQKRAKRAAKETEQQPDTSKFICVSCNAEFPSKTQLFKHVKDLQHAAPISVTKVAGSGGKKGKKK
ncbi:DnaJ-domain-containing protein [Amniculicola lignicola CBS 123094]|uniref:DnaJ-domain-containing protein n=1 Tax=Amniculicola lignicola CBS 123094 TaxID=1392246 RepID=A0A6A5VW57_9PLEO|nr:DnaJ-domain-containing protein [Amniculicola lignicola CBS 123094]